MKPTYLGRFARYDLDRANPLYLPGVLTMRNANGVDLYDARDDAGPGVFLVTNPKGTIYGAAPFPYVAFPSEGHDLWHIRDAETGHSGGAEYLGGTIIGGVYTPPVEQD